MMATPATGLSAKHGLLEIAHSGYPRFYTTYLGLRRLRVAVKGGLPSNVNTISPNLKMPLILGLLE
jgi:hypothetical protein